MKNLNLILLIVFSFLEAIGAQSKSKPSEDVILMNQVKRLAIAAKVGSLIGVGGSVEAVLPIGRNRLAPYFNSLKAV